jgi:hypothetical protein
MDRDALIAKLLTFPNLEVKVNADCVTYDILEQDVWKCEDTIFINPD